MRKTLTRIALGILLGFIPIAPAFAGYSGTPSLLINGTPAGSSNPVPSNLFVGGNAASISNGVSVESTQFGRTDRSGTITTGGTAQTLMGSNTSRHGWWIQNQSTGNLWINEIGGTAAATQPAFFIPPNGFYENPFMGVSTSAISIYGATTGQAFAAREW